MEYIVESDYDCSDELHQVMERIVRCRDCRFMDVSLKSSMQVGSYKVTECGLWANPKWGAMIVVRDGFCAWGERKEE